MKMRSFPVILLACFAASFADIPLKFVTVDTAPYDGIKRFLWSANVSGIEVDVLKKTDKDEPDLSLVIKFIETIDPDSPINVIFCDSKFLSVAGTTTEIVERWRTTGIDVLTDLFFVDKSWRLKCILGLSSNVLQILKKFIELPQILDSSDASVSFVERLGNEVGFSVGEDSGSKVFINMDKHPDMVGYTSDQTKFYNFDTGDTAPILVGSTSSYNSFTRLTNYVPGVFDLKLITDRVVRKKRVDKGTEYKPYSFIAPDFVLGQPKVVYDYFQVQENEGKTEVMVTAFFIKDDVPLLEMSIERFQSLVWLSKKRVLLIFNRLKHRDHVVNEFVENYRGKSRQMAFRVYNSSSAEVKSDRAMYDTVKRVCKEFNCSWIWHQDSNVLAVNNEAIRKLVLLNVSVVAPLIVSDLNDEDPSVNFWGDTVANGFYKRSPDYKDISQRKVSGLFVVPYASGAFLVRADAMNELTFRNPSYNDRDSDVVFCNSVRKSGHLFFYNAESADMVFINGKTDETVPYPLLEHFPKNKLAFYLSFYMKWDHHRQRDYSYSGATPVQNPCEDVYVMELFTDKFTRNLALAASSSDKWASRSWNQGWGVLDTLSFQDMGYDEGWGYFSKDYLPTLAHRKFAGYESAGYPLQAFLMRMNNSSVSTDALEGNGVYTVLVSISNAGGEGEIFFNDHCKVSPKSGDFLVFPSRLTNRVRFVAPKNGEIINIISFYK